MTKPAGQRAVAGDSLRDIVTASRWNALMDMLDEWRSSKPGATIPDLAPDTQHCTVLVRNDTTETLDRWATVGLSGVTVEPSVNAEEFEEMHVLKAVEPGAVHATRFAVLQESIPAGEIGTAVVCGKTIATVEVINSTDTHANVTAGSHLLTSSRSGPVRILHAEGIGTREALVLINTGTSPNVDEQSPCCGCSPTECFDFQFWEIDNGCPRYFILTVDDAIGCCNGEAGGTHALEYHAQDENGPARWDGPTFDCGTSGDDCGTATWTWSVGSDCGSAVYEWQTDCQGCTYAYTPPTGSGFGTWRLVQNLCVECGGCSGPPSNNPFTMQYAYGLAPNESHEVTWPCEGTDTGAWVLITECECGSASPPETNGTENGDTVSVLCTGEGASQWTLLTNACDCGDPVPPTEPGSIDGEVATTACYDPNAVPECGTSTWERRVCEYEGISGDCSPADLVEIGGIGIGAIECTLLVATGDNEGCPAPTSPVNGGNVFGYRTVDGWFGLEPGETWTESAWVLVSDDCTCGAAIPPRQDLYAPAGTQITRNCESPIPAFWRLIPPAGYDPAELQLIIAGVVRIRYRLPYLRSFCCKCQMRFDVLVDETCSWPCLGVPQSVCIRPLRTGPPGGSCRDYSPVYSLYVEGFEEWPCRTDVSDACAERQAQLDEEEADWPVPHGGHPSRANGSFTLALTETACCGNPFNDPGPVATCTSLACRWQSDPGTSGFISLNPPTYCVDFEPVSGSGDCDFGVGEAYAWAVNGTGRWWMANYILDNDNNTFCGQGLYLYLDTGRRGDTDNMPHPNYAERYDFWELLDDGSIVFKYTTPVANQDKFPQYVMLVPVAS